MAVALGLTLGALGCGDNIVTPPSSDKVLFAFELNADDNPALADTVIATITGDEVAATVPTGTAVTALVARFMTSGETVTVAGVAQTSGVTANDFTAPVPYLVTAADGTTRTYTVTITVAASAARELTSFVFRSADNPGLPNDVPATIVGDDVAATVPFGTDVTELIATFTTTGMDVMVGVAPQESGETANDFTDPVDYTVVAANGLTRTYTVTVTIAPSTAKELTQYAFLAADNAGVLSADVTATITGTAIAATVPFGTDVTGLVASFASTGASVTVGGVAQVSGTTANDFTSPVAYVVTAADASTATYTVTVTIAPDPAKDLTAYAFLSVNNPTLPIDVTATITGTAIAATVPFGTDVTGLVATFNTTGAAVTVGGTPQVSGTTANDFTSPVVYRVTAADTTTQDYTVTVTIAPSPAKDLTAFAFRAADNPSLAADVTATITGTAIAATVPFGTDVTGLVATFTTTGASVAVGGTPQVSGTTANDFTSPVVYRVTAADSTTQDYTVTVAVAASSANAITAFAFRAADNPGLAADVTATITGTAIAATVPFGTDVTGLVATFTTTGTSVTVGGTPQVSGTTANDFTGPVVYVVTADDSSTESYTVTVTIAANPAKAITAFAFRAADNPGLAADVTATITGTAIAATVPFGTDVTGLVATFTTTGTSVTVGGTPQVSGTTANDFTGPVVYVVTADDSSTESYTVTVTIAANPAKAITAFAFRAADNPGLAADVTATITGTAIAASVPFGTDVTGLVATFATTGASVAVGGTPQVSGTTANDFTSPVLYTVTAADSSTQTYTVTVTVVDIVCDPLAAPDGGNVTVDNGGLFPSTATYTCEPGRLLDGDATRTCDATGAWSGADPTCDLAVMIVRVGDGTTTLGTASFAVALEERRITDGGLGRVIELPVAAAGGHQALTQSGTASTEGGLALSSDGRYVTLAGYAAIPGTAAIAGTTSAAVPRVVGRIAADGGIDTTTLVDAFSTESVRSAVTFDGSEFWVAGAGSGATSGIFHVALGGTSATRLLAGAYRIAHIFAGQLFASLAGSVNQIGTGLPTATGQTATPLTASTNSHAFVVLDLDSTPGPDTIYLARDTGATANVLNIQKWTFDGDAWAQDTAFAPALTGTGNAVNARGVAAFVSPAGVRLVVTTVNNRLVALLDDGATSTPAVTVLHTADANYSYRGVARSPHVP